MLYLKHENCKVETDRDHDGKVCAYCMSDIICPAGLNRNLDMSCFKEIPISTSDDIGKDNVKNEISEAIMHNSKVLNRVIGIVDRFSKAFETKEDKADVKGQTKLIPTTNSEIILSVVTLLGESIDSIDGQPKIVYNLVQCLEKLEKLEVE